MFQEYKTINPITAFKWDGSEVHGFTRSGNAFVMGESPVAGPNSVGTPASMRAITNDFYLNVATVAGHAVARIGDYVVRDHLGGLHVMKAEEFESQYAPVAADFDKAPEL